MSMKDSVSREAIGNIQRSHYGQSLMKNFEIRPEQFHDWWMSRYQEYNEYWQRYNQEIVTVLTERLENHIHRVDNPHNTTATQINFTYKDFFRAVSRDFRNWLRRFISI